MFCGYNGELLGALLLAPAAHIHQTDICHFNERLENKANKHIFPQNVEQILVTFTLWDKHWE